MCLLLVWVEGEEVGLIAASAVASAEISVIAFAAISATASVTASAIVFIIVSATVSIKVFAASAATFMLLF